MKTEEDGMEKLVSMEKALDGVMEMHRLVLELKELESRQQKKIQDLEAKERRTRGFLDSIPLRVCIKDRNSLYVYCNEGYASDLKMASGEIVGKGDVDFFPIETAERYHQEDQRVLASGQTEETEEAYAPAGNAEMTVRRTSSPVRDERGDIVGIVTVLRDVSEQKKNEEELRRYRVHLEETVSERSAELQKAQERLRWEVARTAQVEEQLRKTAERYQALFEHTGLPMAVIGPDDTTLAESNLGFRALFGMAGEADGPRKLTDFVCEEDAERLTQEYWAWRGAGDPRSCRKEYVFNHGGQQRKIEVTWATVPENGKVFASFVDLTELREAQERLRRSEERHRALFENAPVPIGVVQDGAFKFMNAEAMKVLGCSGEEAGSRPACDFASPECREDLKNRFALVEEGPGPVVCSWSVARADGEPRSLESRMAKIQWEGRPAILMFMTDVTAARKSVD
ncbi:MAG TPA: PAS domain S-box protein [Thermodesulfobacteriota bacterium]|nr:PAS domain S-box protein [Thermodesulfobacteriota bacterium]